MLKASQLQLIRFYELTGVIKGVSNFKTNNGKNLFTIHSITTKRDYKVECPYFCPARRGDIISGYCMQKDNGQFEFIQNPVVEPSSSKEVIQSAFIVALRGTQFSRWLSDRLYDFFEQEAIQRIDNTKDPHDPVVRNRDLLSAATMEMIAMYTQRFQIDESTTEPLEQLGLTKDQAQKFLRWWYRSLSLRRLYLLGLTKKEIKESCERGWTLANLYYQLIQNPFVVEKIPMDKAQSIVHRYQLSFDQNMIECAHLVRFVDEQSSNRKWSCYPIYALMRKYPRFLELQDTLKNTFNCVIRYNFFYLRHQAEVEDKLTDFLQSKELPKTYCSDATCKHLAEEQITAVEMALNNTVSVVTGGAGTGKTTVISAIADELDLRNEEYLIASFTGKAVSRIKEIVRRKGTVWTLHMILSRGLPPDLHIKHLIVDETSMVPNELLANVLERLIRKEEDLHIVLVGDPNQVQPIEWGDLFNRILLAQNIPTVNLLTDHRRKEKGVLYRNTQQFATEIPDEILFQWGSDCQFIEGGIPEIESIILLLRSHGISHDEITIINPFNRNLEDINERCQTIFIDEGSSIIVDSFGKSWKLGARVMMTVNRYDIDVMNGEEGIICGVYPERSEIAVQFKNGQNVRIPTFVPEIINTMDEDPIEVEEPLSTKLLVLSWAITIHKSQGSEWQFVLFYLPPNNARTGFLNRKLLYTGISRAKDALYVIAPSEHDFLSAIGIEPPMRYDNLEKRLKEEEYDDHYVNPTCTRNTK